MKLAASLLACAALLAGAVDASAAKREKEKDKEKVVNSSKPALVGTYGDWKLYHSASGKAKIATCSPSPKAANPEMRNKKRLTPSFPSARPNGCATNCLS